MVPDLLVQDAEPVADAEALERLAFGCMQRFAPVVAADPPDGIVIDSTGADHLHGGEAAMLEGLVGRLAMSGVTARAAVADTWGAAHALARYRTDPVTIAPPGHGAAAIASLPLAALRLAARLLPPTCACSASSASADLLAQPRAPLDPALRPGTRPPHRPGARPPRPSRSSRSAPPTSSRFAAPSPNRSVRPRRSPATSASWSVELCDALEARGLGARRLDLICHRVDSHAAGDPRRHSHACARRQAADPAALRPDRDDRSRVRD